jgi:hypothetical protein
MTASTFHASFVAALDNPEPGSTPPDLRGSAAERFAVYRNNVHRALGEALAAAYPAVARLVGETFFDAMARVFHALETRRPASLALHGAGFAEFLESFAPVASLPYLPDVARLERAWLESLHAADAAPVDAAAAAEHLDRAGALVFEAHPATRVVTSAHPAVTIWSANRPDADVGGDGSEILDRPEAALITRPRLRVLVTPIDPGAVDLVRALLHARPLAEAIEAAATGFDLPGTLATLLGAGAFSSATSGES